MTISQKIFEEYETYCQWCKYFVCECFDYDDYDYSDYNYYYDHHQGTYRVYGYNDQNYCILNWQPDEEIKETHTWKIKISHNAGKEQVNELICIFCSMGAKQIVNLINIKYLDIELDLPFNCESFSNFLNASKTHKWKSKLNTYCLNAKTYKCSVCDSLGYIKNNIKTLDIIPEQEETCGKILMNDIL